MALADWADWVAVDRSNLLLIFLLLLCGLKGTAQCLPQAQTLRPDETSAYDLYFKWGVVMSRAGICKLSFNQTSYQGESATSYRMVFRTISFAETIFKMRDTMDCFFDQKGQLRYSSKRTHEGNYHLTDELTFSYDSSRTTIHSYRYTPESLKIDTVMNASDGCVLDMLSATLFLRSIDWEHLEEGVRMPLSIAVGRELVKVIFNYHGVTMLLHKKKQQRTHLFSIDIDDDAFDHKHAAAELWVRDDPHHLPVKIRTKLKIGYAEAYLQD